MCKILQTREVVKKKNIILLSLLAMAFSSVSSKTLIKKKFQFVNNLLNPCGFDEMADEQADHYADALIYEDIKGASKLALILAQELETAVGSSECNGLSLDSLDPVPDLSDASLKETLKITYKSVFNYLTHIYFITYECTTSGYQCKNTTLSKEFRRLAGKLQYLLCNVLQASAEVYTRSQSINEIKNNRLHCHSSCSAKELQQCLVITGTVELLKTITNRLEVTIFSRKNSLHPTFFV